MMAFPPSSNSWPPDDPKMSTRTAKVYQTTVRKNENFQRPKNDKTNNYRGYVYKGDTFLQIICLFFSKKLTVVQFFHKKRPKKSCQKPLKIVAKCNSNTKFIQQQYNKNLEIIFFKMLCTVIYYYVQKRLLKPNME